MKTAILDDYQGVALPYFDADATAFTDHVADDDALVERLRPFEAIVAMRERTPFTRERLQRLPNLKLLVTTGMANASIDVAAARELGVTVCGTGGLASPTAELTWGLILAVTRHIAQEDAAVRRGGWQHTLGPELEGRTLAIAGLGRLGARVAKIGQAFGMQTIAWSQNLDSAHARELGVEPVTKDDLLARADVLTIHLKLSERTTGLFADFSAMKPTAYLVNTSRGPIVDEHALLRALRDGTIAGAALDVYDTEPLPRDHPLRSAPNTVLTPHIGYVSSGAYDVFYRDAAEDIAAFLRGEPVRVLDA